MEERLSKRFVQELIIVNSPRISFHQMTPNSYHIIKPIIQNNFDYLSIDGQLNRNYIVCKRCHFVISSVSSNRKYVYHHLENHHSINDTSPAAPKLTSHKNSNLKAKRVPMFPQLKTKLKQPKACTPRPPSPEPGSQTTECQKKGLVNLEPTNQAAQNNTVPFYHAEELVVPISELEPDKGEETAPEKKEKKKRGRKRKSDMDFKPAKKTPKFLSEYLHANIPAP